MYCLYGRKSVRPGTCTGAVIAGVYTNQSVFMTPLTV